MQSGFDQGEGGDPLRLSSRQLERGDPAESVPNQMRCIDLLGIHDRKHIERQLCHGVPLIGQRRARAVPPRIRNNHAVPIAQMPAQRSER